LIHPAILHHLFFLRPQWANISKHDQHINLSYIIYIVHLYNAFSIYPPIHNIFIYKSSIIYIQNSSTSSIVHPFLSP
jgi:hypothetical protein